MHQNLIIKNLIAKLHPQPLPTRRSSAELDTLLRDCVHSSPRNFYNKIMLRVREPPVLPMPSCYAHVEFETAFIKDIADQAQCLVITWEQLEAKGRGILGAISNISIVNGTQKPITRMFLGVGEGTSGDFWRPFKAVFLGSCFVALDSVGVLQLTVNARSKVLPFNSAIPQ
jgi:hypothetical protein